MQKQSQTSHDLRFNVAQLLQENVGATRAYTVKAETMGQLDADVSIVSPVEGLVRLLSTGQHILITGSLTTTLEKSCGRCLERFTQSITLDLEEEFFSSTNMGAASSMPPLAEIDEANIIDDQNILDMTEFLRQDFLLQSESYRYCRDDCHPLCSQCGQNLNIKQCDCSTEIIDSRWAGLLSATM